MFCYRDVLLRKCFVTEMFCYGDVLIQRCFVTEMFCYGDVLLQEMFCYRDVLLQRRSVRRRFVKETFCAATFCMCAVTFLSEYRKNTKNCLTQWPLHCWSKRFESNTIKGSKFFLLHNIDSMGPIRSRILRRFQKYKPALVKMYI
jgi:hypothetical protein